MITLPRPLSAFSAMLAVRRAVCLALVVVALAVAGPGPARAGEALSAEDAYRLAEAGEILLIDVRSPDEWRRTGVPLPAAPVTIHNPAGPKGFVDEVVALVGDDRDRPVALICASGVRSDAAQRYLEGAGFSAVRNVAEGMMGNGRAPGWIARGLPVDTCQVCSAAPGD